MVHGMVMHPDPVLYCTPLCIREKLFSEFGPRTVDTRGLAARGEGSACGERRAHGHDSTLSTPPPLHVSTPGRPRGRHPTRRPLAAAPIDRVGLDALRLPEGQPLPEAAHVLGAPVRHTHTVQTDRQRECVCSDVSGALFAHGIHWAHSVDCVWPLRGGRLGARSRCSEASSLRL